MDVWVIFTLLSWTFCRKALALDIKTKGKEKTAKEGDHQETVEALNATQKELKRLQRSHQQMSTLMAQVNDQQRRTRRLLASMLSTAQPLES